MCITLLIILCFKNTRHQTNLLRKQTTWYISHLTQSLFSTAVSFWNKTILKCWYYAVCRANGGLTKTACVVLFTQNKAALMGFSSSRQVAWLLTHLSSNSTDTQTANICHKGFFSFFKYTSVIQLLLIIEVLMLYLWIYMPSNDSSVFTSHICSLVHYNIPALCVHTD